MLSIKSAAIADMDDHGNRAGAEHFTEVGEYTANSSDGLMLSIKSAAIADMDDCGNRAGAEHVTEVSEHTASLSELLLFKKSAEIADMHDRMIPMLVIIPHALMKDL